MQIAAAQTQPPAPSQSLGSVEPGFYTDMDRPHLVFIKTIERNVFMINISQQTIYLSSHDSTKVVPWHGTISLTN
jgi:hypothetical protein